jgi:hypothetical protein
MFISEKGYQILPRPVDVGTGAVPCERAAGQEIGCRAEQDFPLGLVDRRGEAVRRRGARRRRMSPDEDGQ